MKPWRELPARVRRRVTDPLRYNMSEDRTDLKCGADGDYADELRETIMATRAALAVLRAAGKPQRK